MVQNHASSGTQGERGGRIGGGGGGPVAEDENHGIVPRVPTGQIFPIRLLGGVIDRDLKCSFLVIRQCRHCRVSCQTSVLLIFTKDSCVDPHPRYAMVT